MIEPRIRKDLPIPESTASGGPTPRWAFATLEVGECIEVDAEKEGERARAAAAYYRKRHPRFRFVSKREKDEEGRSVVRIWRKQDWIAVDA